MKIEKEYILWHNSSTNETKFWFMHDSQVTSQATVLGEDGSPVFVGPPWSIVGTSATSHRGDDSILWHNSSTGETKFWFMLGSQVTTSGATVLGEDGSPVFVGPPWSIVGVGNSLGGTFDDTSSILWHNSSTNETKFWFMRGSQVTGRATVLGEDGSPAFVGPPWSIVGANNSKIVWHNSSTNETKIWFMDSNKVTSGATVLGEDGNPAFVGPPWSIVETGVLTFFTKDPGPVIG